MKKKYEKPQIREVMIDTDISMVMMSEPPGDPTKSVYNDPTAKFPDIEDKKTETFESPFE